MIYLLKVPGIPTISSSFILMDGKLNHFLLEVLVTVGDNQWVSISLLLLKLSSVKCVTWQGFPRSYKPTHLPTWSWPLENVLCPLSAGVQLGFLAMFGSSVFPEFLEPVFPGEFLHGVHGPLPQMSSGPLPSRKLLCSGWVSGEHFCAAAAASVPLAFFPSVAQWITLGGLPSCLVSPGFFSFSSRGNSHSLL